MEFLLLVAIAGVVIWMWNRIGSLEQRLGELEGVIDGVGNAGWDDGGVPTRAIEPAPPDPERAAEAQSATVPYPEAPIPSPAASVGLGAGHGDEEVWPPPSLRARFDFEEVFGRQLPIWGGGIALAIAGFFLVRWSIEKGMLTEPVRVAMGFAFGVGLLGAAEIACRFEQRVRDERVRQAFAGAGLATLYASFYLAGTRYGLIGPATAFAGLAIVTALAIALSFRFGLPSAVLGLVGGFAAPMMVASSDPNLPVLATYLALVTGGLAATGQRQRRPWLGLAALAAGLGWGVLMLIGGPLDESGILAIGFYLLLIGTLLPAMSGAGPLGRIGRIAAAGLATLQIAALVDQSGYSLLAWGCYGLLGAALAILGVKHRRLREAGAIAAGLSVCLLAAWPAAPGAWFAVIAATMALIFAGAPLFHVLRGEGRAIDWGQLALYPVALTAAICIQRGVPLVEGSHPIVALGALALGTLPALAAWKSRPSRAEAFAPGPFAVFASAFVMAIAAGLLMLPQSSAPLVTGILALPAFLLLRGRAEAMPRALQWTIAVFGLILLLATSRTEEVRLLTAIAAASPEWFLALRWLAVGLPFILLLVEEREDGLRRFGEALAALLGYGAAAMLLPGAWLPLAIALALLGLAWRMKGRDGALLALLLLGGGWAAPAMIEWAAGGIAALAEVPFLLSDAPALSDTLRYVAPFAAAVVGALLLGLDDLVRDRRVSWFAAFALVAMVAHVAFKEVFAIDDATRFVLLGLAERTVWQALLALVAIGLVAFPRVRPSRTRAGQLVALAALSHFAVFSLLLHNPLWTGQAVGAWPIANLLPLSYGVAIGLILWLRGMLDGPANRMSPIFDAAAMLLIFLLALSELRQVFSGSLLHDPVGQQEDLLRSILAIVVALGFLAWGSRTGQRSWRIGSLVLMLLAVFKVFLADAAVLEGLSRVASFFALGICLIGIGWFYSNQLVRKPRIGLS